MSAPGRVGIIACAIGRAKKVAVPDLRKIALVAFLGEIMKIGSGRALKLLKEHSREGRDIRVGDRAREKDCRLRIARNCMGIIFRPNNEYRKWSPAKIIKGALSIGSGY